MFSQTMRTIIWGIHNLCKTIYFLSPKSSINYPQTKEYIAPQAINKHTPTPKNQSHQNYLLWLGVLCKIKAGQGRVRTCIVLWACVLPIPPPDQPY